MVSGKAAAVIGANIHISGGTIACASGPALICIDGENTISGGTLTVYNSSINLIPNQIPFPAPYCFTVSTNLINWLSAGVQSKNSASAGYAIYILKSQHNDDDSTVSFNSELRLSGKPSISGAVDIWTNTAIYADNGAGSAPAACTGSALTLDYSGDDKLEQLQFVM